MSNMEHQEVDLAKPQNQDLIWDLGAMGRRELAERFIQLFENRLCVYSESVSQLYTNYNLHFPSEMGRKMVVLPNPYAFTTPCMASRRWRCVKLGCASCPGW